MINLKQYGYIEAETPPLGLIPRKVTELQREQFTVLATLADGSLSREHCERYLAQRRENKFVDYKSGYLMEKRAWHKSTPMQNKGKNGGHKK